MAAEGRHDIFVYSCKQVKLCTLTFFVDEELEILNGYVMNGVIFDEDVFLL